MKNNLEYWASVDKRESNKADTQRACMTLIKLKDWIYYTATRKLFRRK